MNRLVQEGIERPVGMFGITSRRGEAIETAYGSYRYQGVGEADDRF